MGSMLIPRSGKAPFLIAISCLQNIQWFSVRWGFWKNLGKNLRKYWGIFKMIFEIQWKFQNNFQNFRLNLMWTIKNFKIWRKNLENFDYLYFQEIKRNFCKYRVIHLKCPKRQALCRVKDAFNPPTKFTMWLGKHQEIHGYFF